MKKNENNKNYIEQLRSIEKRVDDTKLFTNIAISVVGAVFIAFAIFAGFSLKQERESLNRLEDDTEKKINELIGLSKREPELICTTIKGTKLQGSTIKGKLIGSKVKYHYMIKNTGNGETTNINSTMYSKEPLVIASTKGSDEDFYDYISPSLSWLQQKEKWVLPPGYATIMDGEFNVVSKRSKAKGIHPMLIKFYYGKEEPLKVEFNIIIE